MSQPSKTLYVNNLNDKVKKPELRHSLYQLFTPYGRIVDIVACKTSKTRGQAFIAFKSQTAATAAQRALDGEVFYGKPLKIAYAKAPSKALSGDAQSYVPAAAMKVTVSNAQKEADDLKRAREEEDTIAERGGKRQKADGDEAMDEDDDAPGPTPPA